MLSQGVAMQAAASAREWIEHDPDAGDRAELRSLVDRAESGDRRAADELDDRMSGMLRFGTAGLRGAIGAGPNRMNTAVVIRATAGLCAVLRRTVGDDIHVVIGHDARHRSWEFARTVAGVVVAAGGRAFLLPHATPTPVLAFAINDLDTDAGVMITASHNPARDNGYKVYLGGRMVTGPGRGAQLVSPLDEQIMAAIEASGPADGIPVTAGGWQMLDESVEDSYLSAALALNTRLATLSKASEQVDGLRVVLTAMHGVGAELASRVLGAIGVADLQLVAAQREPDPDFPTVAFPNPEEPGALDLAITLARQISADLVVALDPDADRCSLAVPDGSVDGGWRQLTGDQVGALLGEYLGACYAGDKHRVLARSIVSSSLLDAIAAEHRLGSAQTLTGFKWIARTPGLVYGYEEALGYCVNPQAVRDKDGITAALVGCRLAASLKQAGRSMLDLLDDLAVRHGLHATAPLTFRVDEAEQITAALRRLAAAPPSSLGGSRVREFVNLMDGYLGLPPTPGYRLETERGDRVVVRPSGTEPKLKCYLEVVEEVAGREQLANAKAAAAARLTQIKQELTACLGL